MLYRIKHLSLQKIYVSDAYYFNYTKIRANSDDDLPLEKPLNTENIY